MPQIDGPTRALAKLYYVIWVIALILLAIAGIMYGLGLFSGGKPVMNEYVPQLLVQVYLLLVPAAILSFSIWMTVRREWVLSLTGYILTGIWVGAKLLG